MNDQSIIVRNDNLFLRNPNTLKLFLKQQYFCEYLYKLERLYQTSTFLLIGEIVLIINNGIYGMRDKYTAQTSHISKYQFTMNYSMPYYCRPTITQGHNIN